MNKKTVKCEICEKELFTGLNFAGLFGQAACSDECMAILAKKRAAETADRLNRQIEKDQL
jgi:hypothetical protein